LSTRQGRAESGTEGGLDVSNGDDQTVVLGSDVAQIERALLKMVKLDIAGLEATAEG